MIRHKGLHVIGCVYGDRSRRCSRVRRGFRRFLVTSARRAEGGSGARRREEPPRPLARLTVGTICCAPSADQAPRPRPPSTSPINKSPRAGCEHSLLDLSELSLVPTPLRDARFLVTVVYVWQCYGDNHRRGKRHRLPPTDCSTAVVEPDLPTGQCTESS